MFQTAFSVANYLYHGKHLSLMVKLFVLFIPMATSRHNLLVDACCAAVWDDAAYVEVLVDSFGMAWEFSLVEDVSALENALHAMAMAIQQLILPLIHLA